MGFFVPKKMRQCKNWILHENKIPINPITGKKTDPTKKGCSYDEALAFLEYGDNSCSGLGFTLTKDINMTFIDIDHCINENGEFTELAEEMMDLFSDCYQEISLSEEGLHIICIGNIPNAVKNEKVGIEMYSCNRFMAFTGNSISAVEPQEAQNRLDDIFHRFNINKAQSKPQTALENAFTKFSDTEEGLVEKIRNSRQGEKWENLHKGDIKGYRSTSEAAMAYIAILGYFAEYNIEMITNIMSKSNFANTKHCKPVYIERAVAKAKATSTGSITEKKRVTTKIIDDYEAPVRKRRRRVRI